MTIQGTAVSTDYRAGMGNLITIWRNLVDDQGTATWTNLEAQAILDYERKDFFNEALTYVPQAVSNGGTASTIYTVYHTTRRNLEESTSGTMAWRVFDSNGSMVSTSGYSVDYKNGIVTFTADQAGSARYLNGREYDIYRAAARGWLERTGTKSSLYDFQADGAQYTKSQWFDHCVKMAEYYENLAAKSAGFVVSDWVRTDIVTEPQRIKKHFH